MTDRIHSLTVTIERNTREDDADIIVELILGIKGVKSVTKHVSDAAYELALANARSELLEKLMAVLRD